MTSLWYFSSFKGDRREHLEMNDALIPVPNLDYSKEPLQL